MDRPEDETKFVERVIADWPAGEPPANFTDKVLAATQRGSKPRPRWMLFAGLGAAAAMAAAGLAFVVQSRGDPPGIVTFVEGAVEVESHGVRSRPSEGFPLESAHLIVTTTGQVELALLKRARVSIGPRSQLVVGPGLPAARLDRGRAAFDVLPGKEKFRVDTPVGSVIVTGTAFEIEVLDNQVEGQEMLPKKAMGLGIAAAAVGVAALVHVSRGAVRVETNEGNAPVRAGEQVTLIPGQSPRPVGSDQAILSPDSTARAQLAAVGLALENARLKSEVSALKSRTSEPSSASSTTDAVTQGKEGAEERQRARVKMTPEEREFVKDAQKIVLSAQAQELRRCCPELLKDNPNIGDEDLLGKAAATAISGLMKPKENGDKAKVKKLLSSSDRPGEGASLEEKTLWQIMQRESLLRAELEKNVSRERAAELAKATPEGARVNLKVQVTDEKSDP